MSSRGRAATYLLTFVLGACASSSRTPVTYVGASGNFVVPSGWNISWPPGSVGSILTPDDKTQRVNITVLSGQCSTESSSRRAAQEYLDYVHETQDPDATFETVGTILHPEYGKQDIYRVRADYHSPPNERLVIFMSNQGKCAEIELFSADPNRTDDFLPIFYQSFRSFRFNSRK